MPIDSAALGLELVRLRRGRGMLEPNLSARLGTQTMIAFGIEAGDRIPVIRRKATACVTRLLAQSSELRTAALAGLALHREADQRRLTDREAWLATYLVCDVRTARRRVAAAMDLLVDKLVEADHAKGLPEGPSDDGYLVRTLWATMRLDTEAPELREKRRIVVTADRLDTIVGRLSVPRSGPDIENRLDVRAGSGGEITSVVPCSPEHFEFTLRLLPRPLRHGHTHVYEVAFTIPADQPMRPHYVFQPLVPCEQLALTVHFDRTRRPEDIWLINGVVPRLIEHDQPEAQRLQPNARGIVRHTFRDLRQGLAYGARWRPHATGPDP